MADAQSSDPAPAARVLEYAGPQTPKRRPPEETRRDLQSSNVTIQRDDGGLTLVEVQGDRTATLISIVLGGVMLLAAGVIDVAKIMTMYAKPRMAAWESVPFMAIPWLFGAAVLLLSLFWFFRRVTVRVEKDGVSVTWSYLTGKRKRHWPADRVTGIKAISVGQDRLFKPLGQLWIAPQEDEAVKLMADHSMVIVAPVAEAMESILLQKPEAEIETILADVPRQVNGVTSGLWAIAGHILSLAGLTLLILMLLISCLMPALG